MKIEKMSDNQIKFILSKDDLVERDIKITELAYGSEKAQNLFREMMEQAFVECEFEAENVPLMIEAIPVTAESIIIVVTKVTDRKQLDEKFDMLPKAKDPTRRRFKSRGAIMPHKEQEDQKNVAIFSFGDLDSLSEAAGRLSDRFSGGSALFKNDGRYFLFISNDAPEDCLEMEYINSIMQEYGQKHSSNLISRYFLIEHGETLLKEDAVSKLSLI